jgi:hypothetical protein
MVARAGHFIVDIRQQGKGASSHSDMAATTLPANPFESSRSDRSHFMTRTSESPSLLSTIDLIGASRLPVLVRKCPHLIGRFLLLLSSTSV